jgi:hypothetical protein
VTITCRAVAYRQGFIEVTPGVHPGCVNVETWQARPDIDLGTTDRGDANFPADGIEANTELELTVADAERLVAALQQAIAEMRDAKA